MIRITMPQAGQSMEEGTIVRWLKQEGDAVTPGELLLEIETDKTTLEVESAAGGTLRKILAAEGTTLPVHAPIAILGDPGEEIEKAVADATEEIRQTGAGKSMPAGSSEAVASESRQDATSSFTSQQKKPERATSAPPAGAVLPLLMPQAGQSMEEGTIVRWRVAPGDRIKQGDIVLEVETDKAVVEVEAPDGGRLARIVAQEGQTVEVKKPIAYLAENDADVDAYLAAEGLGGATVVPSAAASPSQAQAPVVLATPPTAAVVPVLMPQAGQSMEEGTIVRWRVGPGDEVKVGDILFEVETDKSVVEVEATDAGRLARIVVGEGGTIEVKKPVAYLAENDADVSAYLAAGAESRAPEAGDSLPRAIESGTAREAKVETRAAAQTRETGGLARPKASPAARKIASQRGVELRDIGAGSGPGGRILSTDVATAHPTATRHAAERKPVPPATTEPVRRRMSAMRKAIARNLTASKQTIPHFYMRLTIDADPLMKFYRACKADYPCSLNDVLVLALSRVIREFPHFRTRIEGEELVEYPFANIGIAVGMEDGLVVPVLQRACCLTLAEIGAESRRLIERARAGKIEGMGTGVFTVSNLGMFGVDEFSAIINPPEAAIMAISGIREAVIVQEGTLRAGRQMTMTLSCDHRVIDGLIAAQFMARLRELLEEPERIS